MKLADLQTDVSNVASQLETKYGRTIKAGLRLNPDDLGEIILSFHIGLAAPVVIDTTATEVVQASEVGKDSVVEAVNAQG